MALHRCWKRYQRFRQKKLVTVEPFVFLYIFAYYLVAFEVQLYVINQYQAAAIASAVDDRNSTDSPHCRDLARPNGSLFACISNADLENCTNSSESDNLADESSTTLILLTNVAGQVPSVLVTMALGPLSDRAGRRKPLMLALPAAGATSAAAYLLVMYLRLDLHFLVLGALLGSLGGGIPGLLTASFSYISDLGSDKWMTYRLGLVEGLLFVGIGMSTAAGGMWLTSSDCTYPYLAWLGLAIFLAAGAYVLAYLPESLDDAERLKRRAATGATGNGRSSLRVLLRGMEIILVTGHSRWRLWFFLYTLGSVCFISSSLYTVSALYFIHRPLQWSAELIGYYVAVFCVSHSVVLVFVLPVLVSLKIHDSVISFGGMLVSALVSVLNIFVQSTWQMFTIGLLSSIEAIATPPIRSLISKSVNSSDQGAVFSIFAAVQNISSIVAAVIITLTYRQILMEGWPAGSVFSLTALLAASTLPLLIVVFLCRNKRGARYSHLMPANENSALLDAKCSIQNK